MKIIKNILLFTVLTLIAISCETDFAPLGSDIVGGDNFSTESETYTIITYNQPIPPVQTDGLPNYLLGYFNDPIYGGSSASILSQMAPIQFDPDFTDGIIQIDSVILSIPYFSRAISSNFNGQNIFNIDSIYGNSPINLSVFENNFFLRDFDPSSSFEENQRYFSNGSVSLTESIPISQLEGQLLFESTSFFPDLRETILTTIDQNTGESSIVSRSAPELRLNLGNPNNFWEDLIFNREGEAELSNVNNFNNHFRGIYIKAEPRDIEEGVMLLLNLASPASNITIFYNSQSLLNGELVNGIPEVFTLTFSGNTVNLFENDFTPLPEGNIENGDEQLFLKGGQGSMAVINLFNGDQDGNSPEFEAFKNDFIDDNGNLKRVVNEAFIEFTVDQTIVQGEEPNRVYIYDLNNNTPLIDYFLDQSSTADLPEARNIHLRPLTRLDNDPNGEGQTYRIRITEHINNLILRDSTNVKLGLVVAANVDTPSTANQFLQDDNQITETIPVGAILSPRGTVLIGNNTTDEARRVQFRVFFTEPNK